MNGDKEGCLCRSSGSDLQHIEIPGKIIKALFLTRPYDRIARRIGDMAEKLELFSFCQSWLD
jgi:hypothetical protein